MLEHNEFKIKITRHFKLKSCVLLLNDNWTVSWSVFNRTELKQWFEENTLILGAKTKPFVADHVVIPSETDPHFGFWWHQSNY